MSGHGEKFSRRAEAALAALLTCDTVREAAAKCKLSESTLQRWLADPAFKGRLTSLRRAVLDSTTDRLAEYGVPEAQYGASGVRLLHQIARDEEAPATARVQASKAIVDGALKVRELDLAARIAALEQILLKQDGRQ